MHGRLSILFLAMFAALPLAAQSKPADHPDPTLELGRRTFEQRCPVCHTYTTINSGKSWGPILYDDLVNGNEEKFTHTITNGVPGRMPGFKYTLKPNEIDAIVQFLATIPRMKPGSGATAAGGSDE